MLSPRYASADALAAAFIRFGRRCLYYFAIRHIFAATRHMLLMPSVNNTITMNTLSYHRE